MLDGRHPHRIARALTERWQDVEVEFHRAYWQSQIEATPESEKRRADLELEVSRLKGDADALNAVNAALGREIHDPILRRQLEILRLLGFELAARHLPVDGPAEIGDRIDRWRRRGRSGRPLGGR